MLKVKGIQNLNNNLVTDHDFFVNEKRKDVDGSRAKRKHKIYDSEMGMKHHWFRFNTV